MSPSANTGPGALPVLELHARYHLRGSRILLGRGLNAHLAQALEAYPKPRLLVSESQVARARQEQLEALMDEAELERLVLRAGEEGKSSVSLLAVLAELHTLGAERGSPLIAYGGGMVGDLGGLAASLWKRGMPLILVPTSLLAMVDACVGGKTAINFGGVRNAVGSFWPADMVLIDLEALATLPMRQWISGYGELLKAAWLSSEAWARELENAPQDLLRADHPHLAGHVERALRFKIALTEQDEHDHGVRTLLNLGHTLAHVLELREEVELAHGQAVLLGMLAALLVSRECRQTTARDARELEKRLLAILANLDLLGLKGMKEVQVPELVAAMACDKKVQRGRLRMVLPVKMGHAVVADVDLAPLGRALEAWKERVA